MRTRSALRNQTELLLARALLGVIEYSPRPVAAAMGQACAGLLDLAVPRLRQSAMQNLTIAYPDCDDAWKRRTADGCFASIGRVITAFAKFPRMNRANIGEWIRYEGYEHCERALGRGKGVLFATGHLGTWELCAFSHALLGHKVTVIMRPLDNPLLSEFVKARRELSGNALISKREFVRSILQALKNKEAAGMLMDQNSAADAGIFVPFFGKPACTNYGFAKLAAKTGAPVIPVFALWDEKERRHVQRFYPEVPITGDLTEDTARIQAAIEAAIREHPDQWLWVHRRWKTRPEGEPPLYVR